MRPHFKASALTSLAVIAMAATAQADVNITFQSATDLSNLTVGQSFNVDVNITGISPNLVYTQFKVSSDASLLNLSGSTPGPIIPLAFQGAAFQVGQESPTVIGVNAYGGYTLSGSPYIGPDGLLGRLHFTALATGSGSFQASNFSNLDSDFTSPAGTSGSLAYTIVPEPASLGLLGSVAAMALRRRRR